LVSRGQIKECKAIERIEMAPLYLALKDYAIDLEIEREFYRDLVILSSSSQNPEKFSVLDKIRKLYNNSYKTSMEKMIEQYKQEFGDGKTKVVKIRTGAIAQKKISEIVKNLPQK